MKNWHFERYEEQPGDERLMVVVDSGEVYVACTSLGGSGTELQRADAEHPWISGSNEYLDIFQTKEEAAANGYVLRTD